VKTESGKIMEKLLLEDENIPEMIITCYLWYNKFQAEKVNDDDIQE
jgi:hypothetical protein